MLLGRSMTKLTSPSKLAFTCGALTFSAEGDAEWCEKQLHAVLNATALSDNHLSPQTEAQPEELFSFDASDEPAPRPTPRRAAEGPSDFSLTLTNYLKARSVSNRRFHRADGGGGRVSVSATE